MEFSPGMSAGSWSAGGGGMYPTYDAIAAGGGGGGDQMYPFDSPEPWLHGYFQEMPAYGGHATFRPHNYKHVLAQMQQAGSWGVNPAMVYSHQWYHRYRQRAGMHPNFGAQQGSISQPSFRNVAQAPVQQTPQTQLTNLQQAAAFRRGYLGPAIPGISTPYYQHYKSPAPVRSIPAVQPVSVSTEYLKSLETLRDQMQRQSFQLQTMQQQLETSNTRQTHQQQPWARPNHQQFSDQSRSAYQELPAPSAQQAYPGQGMQNQAPIMSQQVPQTMNMAPMIQPRQQFMPQQQMLPQPNQALGYPIQNYPAQQMQNNGYIQSQPIMQLPQQAYFSAQQASPEMAQNYGVQNYPHQNALAMWQYGNRNMQQMPMNQPQQFVPYGNVAPMQQQFQGQQQMQYPVQQQQFPMQQMQNDGYPQQQQMPQQFAQPVNGYAPQPGYTRGY
jgi:hypothetical protein